MDIKNQIKRYGLFLIGLFVASLGVAFSTKAGLGTSPVASVPYSVSIVNHALTFGMWLNALSIIQIVVQVALLRRKSKPAEIIIQTVLAFVYGYMTDFSCKLLNGIPPLQAKSKILQNLYGTTPPSFQIRTQKNRHIVFTKNIVNHRTVP